MTNLIQTSLQKLQALSQEDGFHPRQAQAEMTQAVAQTFKQGSTALIEAGTGTGKTYAYGIPALLSGQKVLISTATKNLQSQLVQRDLPALRKKLGIGVSIAMLKGRENYLCPKRLAQAAETGEFEKYQLEQLARIQNWAAETLTGDKAHLTGVDENERIWGMVTAQREFCQVEGKNCSTEEGCYYQMAKRQAAKAEILVVNHHLLSADLALRQTGFGEVLPECKHWILDEAHQFADILAGQMSVRMSTQAWGQLLKEVKAAVKSHLGPHQALADALAEAMTHQKTYKDQLKEDVRLHWNQLIETYPELPQLLNQTLVDLQKIHSLLVEEEETHSEIAALLLRLESQSLNLSFFADEQQAQTWVRYGEVKQGRLSLNMTPVSVGHVLQDARERSSGGWIFTSATLATSGEFTYLQNQLGLFHSEENPLSTLSLPSPFDYAKQAKLVIAKDIPPPNDMHHTTALMQWCLPLLEANQGHAFLLFSSHRALENAYGFLQRHLNFPLLKQGDMGRDQLLKTYLTTPQAVLLGAASFWEGVDVPGDQLSLVVIDKLPFTPPDDPVMQAKIKQIEEAGYSAFTQLQLPHAIMSLKQGAGRLIRHEGDYGVLVLGDNRLLSKSYGKSVIASLPPMEICDKQTAVRFLHQQRQLGSS